MIDATTTTTPPETKICTNCGDEKSIHRFRHRSLKAGTRHNQCHDCHAADLRKYTAAKRSKDLRTFVHQVPRQRTLGALLALVKSLVKRFGGVEQLAEFWMSELNARMQSKPGSKANLDSCRTIWLLMRACDEHHQNEEKELAEMAESDDVSEEDLRRIIRETVDAEDGSGAPERNG